MWPYVEEIEDLNVYFLSYSENELPERSCMWDVLNTIRPETKADLIFQATEHRSFESKDDEENLVEILTWFLEELRSITPQKRKISQKIFIKY